jgi:hypothetical protein
MGFEMANIAQFMARLDPHYQLKLQQIQQSVYAEECRAWAGMEREQYKAGEEWRRTQYKAEQENQRTQNILAREDQREIMRGQNALAVEDARGRNNLNLANTEHGNRLAQMQADLENRMRFSGFELGLSATEK